MEKENVVKNGLTERQKMILYFFIYAILGWILETVFCFLKLGTFVKRGFLYGPLCPMYGFAAVGMIQMLKKVKTNTIGRFFICMIVFTTFEYLVALILESIFGLRWWDYSNERFNIQGRICLIYSVAWGIVGEIFIEKIHPFVKRKVDKYTALILRNIQVILLYVAIVAIIVDFILSIVKYINI